MTLTKAELVDVLFDELRINKATAKDLVENIFEEVRLSLEAGEPVKLSGFGNFSLRNKKQRPGRNPKTGEEVPIGPRRVVIFHPSPKLKIEVERAHGGDQLNPCAHPPGWTATSPHRSIEQVHDNGIERQLLEQTTSVRPFPIADAAQSSQTLSIESGSSP